MIIRCVLVKTGSSKRMRVDSAPSTAGHEEKVYLSRGDVVAGLKDSFNCRLRTGKEYKSENWKQFEEIITGDGKIVANFVQCKHCKNVFKYDSKKGTRHLNEHRNRCLETDKINRFIKRKIVFNKSEKKAVLNAAMMLCTKDMRPFLAVDGHGLAMLCHSIATISAQKGGLSMDQVKDLLPCPNSVCKLSPIAKSFSFMLPYISFLIGEK